jgi:hypothetical protein
MKIILEFVAFVVIIEIGKFYAESLSNFDLKEAAKDPPQIKFGKKEN